MDYSIKHELPGRIRIQTGHSRFTPKEGAVLEAILEMQTGVFSVFTSCKTGSVLILYDKSSRDTLLAAVSLLEEDFCNGIDTSDIEPRPETETLIGSVTKLISGMMFRSMLPRLLYKSITFFRAIPLLSLGMNHLRNRGKLDVTVLDASAVGVSMLRNDFKTAGTIATLLKLGDILEEWTQKKSKESLIESLSLNIDKVWVIRDNKEKEIPFSDLMLQDNIIVRAGSVIPADGTVFDGEAHVNQAVMTGESLPVLRTKGKSVYAGTVVEEGQIIITVTAFDSETRIHKIAEMISHSEALKASIQTKAEKVADAIVPYNFILAAAIFAFTGDLIRASSALMVDYSCAIKLFTPLTILSAMREGANRGVLIKGGKFLEAVNASETIVFDKTGTLTQASPRVAKVISLSPKYTRDEVLRNAACLEEHFPHSVARAVVSQAETELLVHNERHSKVEYVLAHGIASSIDGERVIIGSAHFLFEDEKIPCLPEHMDIIAHEAQIHSILCLAIGGELVGILCIEDPLREDAAKTIEGLRQEGVQRVIMLTGDNVSTAENIAAKLGITEIKAQLLPEQKTSFVNELKETGEKVIMVGDGINDSPALAAADVGISMKGAADIAQEVADVVLTNNELSSIVDVKKLSRGSVKKIKRGYDAIIGGNSLLLFLGLTGILPPASSALCHNLLTIGISGYAMLPILEKNGKGK